MQVVAALAGVAATHMMFGEALFTPSDHARTGPSLWWSEFIATFGLILVIRLSAHHSPNAVPLTVAAYITAAYWFTASTSFANPAVTIARSLTPTFAGIRPGGIVGFIIAQATGAIVATKLAAWIVGTHKK